ncbi:MAG: GNAT family N-acetyltransferase [Bacteroidota bacterium]|jgi:GNAT superfamily N-acetyltransferase|nr:GNAT family N-acetyltransferase [Algoriphagus sp.]
MIVIQLEQHVSLEEFQDILLQSGLSKRRPMGQPQFLERMISGANLLVTARENGQLVGLLRGLSDFCYRTFVADLAVAQSHQRRGIGKQLLARCRQLAPEARILLLSAEDAVPFYQKIGFHLHERCYQLKVGEDLL